jgi:hypothetical protein
LPCPPDARPWSAGARSRACRARSATVAPRARARSAARARRSAAA